jgi:Cu-Zn family superoxide dismutase
MNIRTRRVLVAATVVPLTSTMLSGSPASAGGGQRTSGPLITYSAAVPEGATARVQTVETGSGRTITTLHVSGLAPNTEHGAHAHTKPCGETGGAAGPHFQDDVDPVSPSTNPAYANPENEIWLDLTTNAAGQGRAKNTVDWQFSPTRRAQRSSFTSSTPARVRPTPASPERVWLA